MNAPRPASMMRPKQRFISDQIVENPYLLIVAYMGSGKTAAALDAAKRLLDAGEVEHVLVIAPKLVAEQTWPDEVRDWEHFQGLNVAVATGAPSHRAEQIRRKAQITVISRDNLVWLWKGLRGEENWFFDMLIVDESSMFKKGEKRTRATKAAKKIGERWTVCDPDTGELHTNTEFGSKAEAQTWIAEQQEIDDLLGDIIAGAKYKPHYVGPIKEKVMRRGNRATRFGALCSVRRKISRVYELTGTPAPNGLQDLWGQIYLLDQGERLSADKQYFLSRWFKVNPYSREISAYDWSEKEIMEKIGDIMLSIPPDKLCPDPVYPERRVSMPTKALREYETFAKTLFSEPYDVEAVSSGVLTNKLLQFANGSMYREDGSIAPIHDAKMEALDELVEEAAGENLLVFYSFKFDLERIRERYPHAKVMNETDDVVRQWNEGKIKMLLAHPASCAHGLNMQYGGHIAIWYGLTWSLELYQQACARLPRAGQTKTVAIYHIICEGTVDESVVKVLKNKESKQDSITRAVLAEIEN